MLEIRILVFWLPSILLAMNTGKLKYTKIKFTLYLKKKHLQCLVECLNEIFFSTRSRFSDLPFPFLFTAERTRFTNFQKKCPADTMLAI